MHTYSQGHINFIILDNFTITFDILFYLYLIKTFLSINLYLI
jgi:hypothetical protein